VRLRTNPSGWRRRSPTVRKEKEFFLAGQGHKKNKKKRIWRERVQVAMKTGSASSPPKGRQRAETTSRSRTKGTKRSKTYER